MCRYRMRRKMLRQRNMKKEMQNSLPDLIVTPEVPVRNQKKEPKERSLKVTARWLAGELQRLKKGKQIPRRVRLR